MRLSTAPRVAVLAACTIGGLEGWTRAARGTADRCDASIAAYEHTWRGTGAWRRLAPYPVARDASPTDSIGVWLERSRAEDGTLELRRVSANETVVARTPGTACDVQLVPHKRSYDSAAMATAFTDDHLRALVRDSAAGIVYVWSPRMPLSVDGLAEARAAANTLRISFTAVVADAAPEELLAFRRDPAITKTMSSLELVYRNATIHYPAVVFYRNGALVGSAVPGFKRRDTYVDLAREAFATTNVTTTNAPAPAPPTFWVDRSAQITTTRTVQTVRRVGFFFKPIVGTDLVSYAADETSFLFDLGARRERRIPGHVDPVPTPDGRFLTRPGVWFYWMPALAAGDTSPVYLDRELPDEYQTASILKQTTESVRYRIVTGWRMGARLRDYDVTFDRDGKPLRVQPVATPWVPCPERRFSLPISAKASKEMGVYDAKSVSNRVIDVTDDGRCVDVLDLGFASGKLSFNFDGSAIAFATSRVNTDAEGSFLKPEENFYKDALVLYRKTGRIVSLSSNRPLSGMTFPEFLPDGKLMILEQASRFRPTEVFRVVEVK